jgi:tetratricopeptide (TPR) repeat protein
MRYRKVTSIALGLVFLDQPAFATTVLSGAVAEVQQKTAGESGVEKTDSAAKAEELFAQARAKYEAGDMLGALNDLEQCYLLSHSVNLLYNLALLHNELGDCPKALDHYQRYIRAAADGERHEEVNRQIAALSMKCPPASSALALRRQPTPTHGGSPIATAPYPGPTSGKTAATSQQPWLSIGWIAVGAGAVSGVTAAYFAVRAVQANHDTQQRPIAAEYYKERSSDLTRYSSYAWVFGATSILAMGVGVYALVLVAPKQQDASSGLTATLSQSAGLVGYWLRF